MLCVTFQQLKIMISIRNECSKNSPKIESERMHTNENTYITSKIISINSAINIDKSSTLILYSIVHLSFSPFSLIIFDSLYLFLFNSKSHDIWPSDTYACIDNISETWRVKNTDTRSKESVYLSWRRAQTRTALFAVPLTLFDLCLSPSLSLYASMLNYSSFIYKF